MSHVPGPARVAVLQATPERSDRALVFDAALAAVDLPARLEAARAAASVPAADLPVVIKVELTATAAGDPAGTDPWTVARLVDHLARLGFTQVVVGDTRDELDLWLENRDPHVAAELLGFDGSTPDGAFYEVADLSQDLVEVDWPAGSVLAGSRLPRAWVQAGFRLLVGGCRTHPTQGFALATDNLLRLLPLRDKGYHYRARLDPADLAPDLLRAAPPDLVLVDAWTAGQGERATPTPTRTLFVGGPVHLVDHAVAARMGLDPATNPGLAGLLRQPGLPPGHQVLGSLAPWAGWQNVPAGLRRALAGVAALPEAGRILAWSRAVDPALFPFRDPVDEQLHGALAGLHQAAADNPLLRLGLSGLYAAVATGTATTDALRVLTDKEALPWREVPLGIDPEQYGPDDFASVIAYLEPLEELIAQTPADEAGLSWRYLDGSVLFCWSQELGVPFERWVERVDVSRAVQFMNDYIGGACVVVERDEAGRALRQCTRTIYLPQPNFMALYGGPRIDVCKLEIARYQDVALPAGAHTAEHKVWWRTVRSPNASATYDDGSVSFRRLPDGGTQVVVVARQQFRLPPFWELVDMDRFPLARDRIVAWAYREYFQQTIANFEARYEGRPHRIGRAWDPDRGEQDGPAAPDTVDRLRQAVERLRVDLPAPPDLDGALQRTLGRVDAAPTHVDEDGFAHFEAAPPLPGPRWSDLVDPGRVAVGRQRLRSALAGLGRFMGDLGRAVERDLGGGGR